MPFDYQPLRGPDSIRLLNIHSAGQESDQLICSLEPAQLGECRYEALSYVWGNAQARKAIICNDGIISITENCYRALRSLTARRITPTSSHLRLWVDAICINQSDSQERSSQVLLLPRIFESATAVIAWLG
ncbi:heterokaryon incompatibility protein-domain-containing protein, partial [Bisporella sp. PMI_857]